MLSHQSGVQNGLYHIIVSFEQGATGQLRPYEGEKPATASYSSVPIQISKGETIRLNSSTAYALGSGSGYNAWAFCNIIGIPGEDGIVEYTATGDTWITIITNDLSALAGMSIDRFWNQVTVIDEPIGFDDLQSTIKRHDYHGMGAEVSMGSLEFYGAAFNIIAGAYAADIDSEVLYEVLAGTDIIYSGKLDLSTYSVKQGDYRSVSVKVGEIGTKTTFNNRTDKEVGVDDPNTIDGAAVDSPEWLYQNIPMKHLLYTNTGKQQQDNTITSSGGVNDHQEIGVYIGTSARYIFIPIGEDINTEFGQLTSKSWGEYPAYDTNNLADVAPQYIANDDHVEKYGNNTVTQVDIVLDAKIIRKDGGWSPVGQNYIKWHLIAADAAGYVIEGEEKKVYKPDVNYRDAEWDLSCELHGQLSAGYPIKYYLMFDIDLGTATSQYFYAHIIVKKGSYVKMTMYDNLAEDVTKAKMILVHDALNVVSHAISENALSVKSDWYRTPESHWEYGSIGGGALKALTNGYKIRGIFTDGETKRNMTLSFKSLIENLSALDCIGWGFSKENGVDCVRVERWDWFYKDDVILTLDNVNDIQIDVDTDRIPTELKIGYKKYATQDQYNSIDSPHGTRTFINGIKALSKTVTKESEFIADNYAIEETRRARTQKNETEESTYDENIFVFELHRMGGHMVQGGSVVPTAYSICHSAIGAVNVGMASELINAKLTPRHMAARWRDFLFATNNSTPFRFTSGEINYLSSFSTSPEDAVIPSLGDYLDSFAITSPQAENDDITYIHAKFKAEKISFSFPLTVDQYKTILANPYGLIRLTDDSDNVIVDGWIMDFKYSIHDGTADFTLLAKYVTNN